MAGIDEQARPPVLSVVVPVFNGGSFIADTVREIARYLVTCGHDAELIVVDDGSTDDTAARAGDAAAGSGVPARVVSSPRNEGKGAAVKRGMELARGEYRVFLDADLAYPPTEIATVVACLAGGADVAVASRVHEGSRYLIRPSFFRYLYTRHVAGRMFNSIVRTLLLPAIRDSQAGLKGFRARAAQRLFAGWLPSGFSFDLGLLYRARRLGMRIEQIPVLYRYDREPTTVRFVLDTLVVLRDLLQIRVRVTSMPSDGRAAGAGAGEGERREEPRAAVAGVLASPATRAVLAGVIGIGVMLLVVTRVFAPNGSLAVGSWLAILFALVVLAWRADRGAERRVSGLQIGKGEAFLLGAVLLTGASLRFLWLEDLPPMMHGDTAECGLRGLEILRGEVADVFDFSPWYNTPFLSFVPYALSFAVSGLSVFALRLPSAVFGVATVVAFYVLVRAWFEARVALLSTALFAVSHAGIHFSRIGLWNIQVLFYALAAFALIAVGLRKGSALAGVLAGVSSGLALYSYTAGRLVPLVVVIFLATLIRSRPARRLAAFFVAGLVLTAVPLALNYVKDPSVLAIDRVASVWVFADENRFHVESTLGETTAAGILAEQVRRTLAGFVALGDTSAQYGTAQPLLSPPIAALFLIGIVLALRSVREPRHRFLVIWLVLGLLLGSVFIVDPPAFTRLIIIFPLPFILAAVGLDACVRLVHRRFPLHAAEVAILYVLILAQSSAFNLVGYHRFIETMESVPREWDVLRVFDRLKDHYDYYLFTGPFLFSDSPVLRLFSTGTRAVSGLTEVDLPSRLGRDAAFVVAPEFRRLGFGIAQRFPSAERLEVSENGVVKAFVYTCTVANGCRHGAG